MYKLFLFIILFIFSTSVFSQDLNCTVEVTTPQIQQTDKTIFDNMKKALNEFVKNRKWTSYNLKPEERIECTFLFNITERVSTNEFKGTLQISARRPVYKSAYNSTIVNYIDKDISFKWEETQPLEFDETTNLSDLTSTLAFYVYIILGLDFDSFSLNGGMPFFNVAQTIVNNAQNSPQSGWKSFENKRNRYWLVENLLNPSYQSFHEAVYIYHRKGLDIMHDNMQKGRQEVLESFELMKEVYRQQPGLFLINFYMFPKVDEIVKIFSEAPQNERVQAVKSLGEFDPGNSGKYTVLLNTN